MKFEIEIIFKHCTYHSFYSIEPEWYADVDTQAKYASHYVVLFLGKGK